MKKILIIILFIIFPMIVFALPLGDVDGNDVVGSSDYVLVKKHILKQSILTEDKLIRADVNNDEKVTSLDYIMIKKIIISDTQKSISTLTPTPTPTATPTPVPKPKYEVKIYGASIIETGLSDTLTLSGSVDVPTITSNKINLRVNTTYIVSFDYKTVGGTNQFDVDLYPDPLPQIWPEATTEIKHYDWELTSADPNVASSQLRFFDDVKASNEQDIIISNMFMGTITKLNIEEGNAIGSLPTPSRNGYKFLGWFTSPSGGTQVDSNTIVTSNMTLYPHWEKTMYYSPNDPKYDKYPVVAQCDSNTLKYKILKHTDDYGRNHYVTVVWVEDAYRQMNTALAGDTWTKTSSPATILADEKRNYFPNYNSGCMVAVNASFFDMKNHRNKDAIVISKGKTYKDKGPAELLGFTKDYKFKFYSHLNNPMLNDFLNDGVRNTFSVSHFSSISYKDGKYYQTGKEVTGNGGNTQTTQICQIDKNNFVLINGRGNSMVELFKVTGCSLIYNMDGSGSSKLYYQSGNTIQAIENGDGRQIANMLYFSEHIPKT